MIVTSVNNEHIKDILKLKEKKARDKEELFLVETKNLVEEAYSSNLLKELIILEGNDLDIPVTKTYVSKNVLSKLSDLKTPTPYIGIVSKKKTNILGNRLIILDRIQDPGNLGTIIRSAKAFNFDTVILSDDTVDIYNPKVIRATEGMIFKVNFIVSNLSEILPKLKRDNYIIYGTNVNNGIDIKDISVTKDSKLGIVIGNEGNGISNNVENLCDKNIYIKIKNDCESLNASVAASILMYEVDRK